MSSTTNSHAAAHCDYFGGIITLQSGTFLFFSSFIILTEADRSQTRKIET
uniref:Uncharacterized protein n=1 Tax=Anguilla anguilla TaxID=7936 RepID=A0A0E9SNN1_ANGAN